MSDWKVGYKIAGEEYEVLIPDGSTPGGMDTQGLFPVVIQSYIGHDQDVFELYLLEEHPGVDLAEVELTFSIEQDHPFASFFS